MNYSCLEQVLVYFPDRPTHNGVIQVCLQVLHHFSSCLGSTLRILEIIVLLESLNTNILINNC